MAGASDVASFAAELWEHEGPASWFFVTLPEELSDRIEEQHGAHAPAFGSVRVEVTVGRTRWRTSLFPDTKRAAYVLPMKKSVRIAEGLEPGDIVAVQLVVPV